MSYWTHITGSIEVAPMGRTQYEKEYILKTVLAHLPLVTGSEGNMSVHVLQKDGWNCCSNCDEFLIVSQQLRSGKYQESQDGYIIIVEGNFRDRMFNDTFKEFNNWICRLAKRVSIDSVLVRITSDDHKPFLINADGWDNPYEQMYETPSWNGEGSNWCEYLMWDAAEDSEMPAKLVEKYKKEK